MAGRVTLNSAVFGHVQGVADKQLPTQLKQRAGWQAPGINTSGVTPHERPGKPGTVRPTQRRRKAAMYDGSPDGKAHNPGTFTTRNC